MSRTKTRRRKSEKTPVDDVRRVREKLSAQTGNDVNRMADHAERVTRTLRKRLRLKSAGS